MITIKYAPLHSTVVCEDKAEQKAVFAFLYKKFSVWVDGANFTPAYELGIWDGYARFFSKTSGQFPSGLLVKVASALLSEDYEFDVEDMPEPYKGHDSQEPIVLPNGMTMRDYQAATLRKTLKWYRGIWKVATNGGKTEMAAGLLKVLDSKANILILVPRKVIFHQFASRLKDSLKVDKVGMIGDGLFKPIMDGGITVAMYQTLSSRMKDKTVQKWLQSVDVLIVDECQFATAETFKKIIQKCPANFRIGMSGTPFKEEKHKRMEVRGLFGPILSVVSNQELIDKGVSIRPSIMFLDFKEPKVSSKVKYVDAYPTHLKHCETRNKLIAQLAEGFVKSQRQTLIMVRHVDHLKALHRKMPWAETAHANSPNRQQLLDRLRTGEVFALICTPIFDTGLSTDYIEAIINAGGGQSEIEVLQRVGRGLRVAKDKEKDLWIIDFVDGHHRDLRRQASKRLEILSNQEAFYMTNYIHDLPQEVQEALDKSLLNSSHFEMPLLQT